MCEHPPQVLARDRQPLGLIARIRQLQPIALGSERHGALDRRRDRAAAGDRPAPVEDPREKTLLEGIGDVQAARERPPAPGEHDQLERRLAVAVLEILPAQTVAVDAQQDIALRGRDQRHRLGRIETGRAAAAARPCSVLEIG